MTQLTVQLKDDVITGSPEGVATAPVGAIRRQTDAYSQPATWQKMLGADAYGWARVHAVPRVAVSAGPTYTAYGDSFTVGNGASSSSHSYAQILSAVLRASSTSNNAVSGTGVLRAVVNLYADEAIPRTSGLTTILAGFNDLRRGGAAARTLAKIQHCTRAMLAALFAQTAKAADDASVTRTGTWTTFTYAGKAAALSGNALQAVSGATLTATISGDSLILGYLVSDGATYQFGPATVTVDGTVVATIDPNSGTDGISDGTYANTVVPGVLVLRGLGSGAHTVVLTPISGTLPFTLDWIGTLAAPGACAPVLVGTVPRMNATGYALSPAAATDAVMATGSLVIADIVAEFAEFPVRAVWPNTQYDLTTGVYTDNIHPNDIGHQQIARAFLACVMSGTSSTAPDLTFQTPSVSGTMAVGAGSVASAASATAAGNGAQATDTNSTAVGKGALALAGSASAYGSVAKAYGPNCLANGVLAVAGTTGDATQAAATAVGNNAQATKLNTLAVGEGAQALSADSTAVGMAAQVASGLQNGTALGCLAEVDASDSTAVGCLAKVAATHINSVAVGKSSTTTRAHQVMLGTASEFVQHPGGLAVATKAVSATYTVSTTSDYILLANATSGAFTITLPAAASVPGQVYLVKKTDSSGNAVTVKGNGAELIDGANTNVLSSQYALVRVVSTGSAWAVI